MMKAIIMEVCGKEAIVLSADGSFVRIQNKGFAVGQEIVLTADLLIPTHQTSKVKSLFANKVVKYAAIAACICLLLGPVLSLFIMNSQSYGYVSVDVNPSIAYHINRFDKVVDVTAANKDGERLLSTIGVDHLEGEDIEVALSLTVEALSLEGYFDGEQAGLIISSSSGTEKASIALNEKLVNLTQENQAFKGLVVETTMVTKELVREAKQLGTTAGKLKLIHSLGDDVDVDAWLDKSVAEIQKAAKDHGSAPVDTATKPNPPIEPQDSLESATAPETSFELVTVPDQRPDPPHDTEAEVESQTMIADEPVTQPETSAETFAESSAETFAETLLEPEVEPATTEEQTIPPEPDKEKDPESWWEWFWNWIFGKQ